MPRKGYKQSEEHKRNLGKTRLRNQNAKGYKHTKEAKERMSKLKLGKVSLLRGTHLTKEHKNKISSSEKGKFVLSGSDSPLWKGGYEASRAKMEKRNRGLGYHRISFYFCGSVWHHVNKIDVVAIDRDIHRHCRHSLNGNVGIPAIKLEGVLG
jgi:hypothetical protein